MEYKFVLWGYGERGKRFLERCPNRYVVAIIDSAMIGRKAENGIPIISYEEYKLMYTSYDVVVTVSINEDILYMLNSDGIVRYHFIMDCPPEMYSIGESKWIEDLPIDIDKEKKYVLCGINIYSFLIRDFLIEKYGFINVNIVSDIKENAREQAFIAKYSYVKERSTIIDETILWCSKKRVEEFYLKYKIQNAYDFSTEIEDYKSPLLKKFANIHEGETCFIIASGPSLKKDDLEVLWKNKCICFGVNRINLLFDEIKWRPDYYTAVDYKIIQAYGNDILQSESKVKIIADKNREFWYGKDELQDVYKIHEHCIEYIDECPPFSKDIVTGIYGGGTVVYACIQIAVYMGFKKIYLLGTDHNYTSKQEDVKNHFHKDYYHGLKKPGNYVRDQAEFAYQSAKQYAEEHGIKIYNATRGGKLEVFERVDFDIVMKGI